MKLKNRIIIYPFIIMGLFLLLTNSCSKEETTIAVVPVLSTSAVSSINPTAATSGGNISSDGGAAITTRGVCWSTSPTPTVAKNKTTDGKGSGSFSSNITGLTPNTTYYVRAYATNSAGTAYGNELSFSTPDGKITLTTIAVSSIMALTATSGGNITNDGGTTITARGVCYSTTSNPTIADNKTTNGNGSGYFVSDISGLTPNTTYYVRAYATNSVGTSYGNEVNFITQDGIATITTTAVSSIMAWTAKSGGDITGDGGSAITARGVCYSTTSNPTIADSKTADGTGTGMYISSLAGLTLGSTYYVRAYGTNSVGTTYGNEVSFTTALAPGDSFQGGIIGYIFQSGDPGYISGQTHGLIAAPSDQSAAAEWGCKGTNLAGAGGSALGTGNQNTMDIINGCSTAGTAARICGDLILNGYSDWFLPSKEELYKLFLNKAAIGGFSGTYYWSSTEHDLDNGYRVDIAQGYKSIYFKYSYYKVRAIRTF